MGNHNNSRRVGEQRQRLFVGIPVPEEIQDEVLEWRKSYEKSLPVRWIDPYNLHVTVLPPWDESDIRVPMKRLKKIAGKMKPFELEFHTVTFGPELQGPRLIWADADTPEDFVILSNEVARKLKKQRPRRQLRVHMTLARFNPGDFVHFPLRHLADEVSWIIPVHSVLMFESHLEPIGARYEVHSEVKY